MAFEKFYSNLGLADGREYIQGMAGRLNMPQEWIERQLNQESRGLSSATSGVGAMGVSQMMPNTWAGLQKNYPDLGLTDPRDARQSLKAYEALMGENIMRTGGDISKAVRAYHGGWDEKNWGPVNRDYINIVSGGKNPVNSPQQNVEVKGTPQKQQEMIQAYERGVRPNRSSVNQFAGINAMLAGIRQRNQELMAQQIDINKLANFK